MLWLGAGKGGDGGREGMEKVMRGRKKGDESEAKENVEKEREWEKGT